MDKKFSDKKKIIAFLKDYRRNGWLVNEGWYPAYKLRSFQTLFGFVGFQGDRRARELQNEGYLERRINPLNKCAEYRYKIKTEPALPSLSEEESEEEKIKEMSQLGIFG